MLCVRAVVLDYYSCKPIDELEEENQVLSNQWQVPVIRIFGSTPDGMKCCVHVHGVYPYMYVPYVGGDNPKRDALLLSVALDEALRINCNQKNGKFIFDVTHCTGIPLYGYHSRTKQFFKILFNNPFHIRKASELLLSGAILNQKFQPHEAHIPYILQFMMDYNIYGMSFVNFSKVKYRRNPEHPESLKNVPTENILPIKIQKSTCCYLEVDALARDIVHETYKEGARANPGLQAIWEDEMARRRAQNKVSQITVQNTQSRPRMEIGLTELMYKERLAKALEKYQSTRLENIPEEANLSSFDNFSNSKELVDETILSLIPQANEEELKSEDEEEEEDSVLGGGQRGEKKEKDEEEEQEEEDEKVDMTQPLELDERLWGSEENPTSPGSNKGDSEEEFWKEMADQVFQLDGAQDSSSESDPEVIFRRMSDVHEQSPTSESSTASDMDQKQLESDLDASDWSTNIMSILSEDSGCPTPSTICQTPQSFWSSFSPKMDSWLPTDIDPWNSNKEESFYLQSDSTEKVLDTPIISGSESYGFDVNLHLSSEPQIEKTSLNPSSWKDSFNSSATNVEISNFESNELSRKNFSTGKLQPEGNKNLECQFNRSFEENEKRLLNVLKNFSTEKNVGYDKKTVSLTLKQYIKDCSEIVNVEFKNLCNREMVIIEYKPVSKKSKDNKFLIKPLDKFLNHWNIAEKKLNNRLWKSNEKNSSTICYGFQPNNELKVQNKEKNIKELNVKSCERNYSTNVWKMSCSEDSSTYEVNENVFSQGKIKMKLTKSQGDICKEDFIENYEIKNKIFIFDSNISETQTKQSNLHDSVERRLSNKSLSEKTCEERKNKFPAKKENEKQNLDTELINKINTKFEEYFKNIVKSNSNHPERTDVNDVSEESKICDKNSNVYLKRKVKSTKRKVKRKEGFGGDPVKLVSKFLYSFSRMTSSKNSEMPSMSVTINLGSQNDCKSTPVYLNLGSTALFKKNAKARVRKKKTEIENVDGAMDSSSEDSLDCDTKLSNFAQKKFKKDGFYKPLNVILGSSPLNYKDSVGSRSKKKTSTSLTSQGSEDPLVVCRRKAKNNQNKKEEFGGECSRQEEKSIKNLRNRRKIGSTGDKVQVGKSKSDSVILDSGDEKESGDLLSKRTRKKRQLVRKVKKASPRKSKKSLPIQVCEKEKTCFEVKEESEESEKLEGDVLQLAQTEDSLEGKSSKSLISSRSSDSQFSIECLKNECLNLGIVSSGNIHELKEEIPLSLSLESIRKEEVLTHLPLSGSPLFGSITPDDFSVKTPSLKEISGKLEEEETNSNDCVWLGGEGVAKSDSQSLEKSRRFEKSFSGDFEISQVFGSKTIKPKLKPIGRDKAVELLNHRGVVLSLGKAPFYGNPKDLTKAIEAGPRVLKVDNNSIAGLKSYKSDLDFFGAEERRNLVLNSQCHIETRRYTLVSKDWVNIIPIRKPPSKCHIVNWCKDLKEKKLVVEEGKTKAKVIKPLSPGQDSDSDGEMDMSLSVSMCMGSWEKSSLSGNVLSPIIEDKEKSDSNKSSRSSQSLPHVPRPSSDGSFQLKGVTCDNTLGFCGSVENLQNVKVSESYQHITLLNMELHVQTRKDLRPDPNYDPIRALFYAVTFDNPNQDQENGVIIVEDKTFIKPESSKILVHHVSSELELFNKLLELIKAWDPDILAGYEIEMNSWGYLIQRGFILEKNLLVLLSRVLSEGVAYKKSLDLIDENEEFDDAPRSIRHMKIPGRIVLDVWRLLRHEIALTSYTFENVMYHLCHQRYPLYSYQKLSFFWEHPTSRFRYIVMEYFMDRVVGTLKVLEQLDFVNQTCELSRLFGIQFYEVLARGSQFRVESMMLRLAKPLKYVPASPSVAQRAAMRAPASLPLILEPESVFYADPVIVLDFQSLYPSMIIAYNYCFSTCLGRVEKLGGRQPFEFGCTELQISPEELKTLENDINISPAGVAFVKSNIRKGVLPAMLEEILETRLMVKKSMKENKENKVLQKLLYARQLGLKLIANVTYGYTAANFSGRMPCIEVGDSVVSKGRETLERAIQLVKNNVRWNAKVVYGDTDSLFVLTPGRTKEEAFEIGAEIADAVTRDNPKPVKLKLEKVYQPCILQTKKRYLGYMYESPGQDKPVFEAKGVETVRRDGCPATAKILQKAIQILFDTRDVSLVKKYTVRQFTKLFKGTVNIQDLIFAKEYRGRKGYRPGACVPALELAKQWTQYDKRAEPRTKERVPYVIVNGPPGVPLIRLVRSPKDLLVDGGLRINAAYYITKAIVPPMQRCFSLLGADVMSWYLEMPRKYHKLYKPKMPELQKRNTLSQYFTTLDCVVCSKVTNNLLCSECVNYPQMATVHLIDKIRRLERCYNEILKICQSCCGRSTEVDCLSLDCPVLFRRHQAFKDLEQEPFLRDVISQYF